MFWRRRAKHWTETGREWIHTLAVYNSEVHRGLVHTDQWKVSMALLQEKFDRLTAIDHPSKGL